MTKDKLKQLIKTLIDNLDTREDLLEISYFITQKEVQDHIYVKR